MMTIPRLEQQAQAAQNDLRRVNDALWHLQAAHDSLAIAGPNLPRLCAPSEDTLHQIRLALKCVQADKYAAEQLADSASRMLDEEENTDECADRIARTGGTMLAKDGGTE